MKYVLLFLLPSVCFAGDWTTTDTAWQAAYTTALALDCGQARDQRPQFEERNPLLGKYPSKGRIDNMCLASAIGHFGVSYALPTEWRRIWQIGSVAAEIVVIKHQYQVGLKFTW